MTGMEALELDVEDHVARLQTTLLALTGRDLFDGMTGDAGVQYVLAAPYALVSHGTQDDPVFEFGNGTALELFELTWDEFTALPSRLSAEPLERDEREALLAEVEASGYVGDYAGVRVSSTGRRFRIEGATVWNVTDESGALIGQAALIDRWEFL